MADNWHLLWNGYGDGWLAAFTFLARQTAPAQEVEDGVFITVTNPITSDVTNRIKEQTERIRQRRGDRTWRGVHDGSLKYVSETTGSAMDEYLFDLNADLGEKNNLLASRAADVERRQDPSAKRAAR